MRSTHLRQIARRRPLLSDLLIHSRCPHRLPPPLSLSALSAPSSAALLPPLRSQQQCRHIHIPEFMAKARPDRPTKPPGVAKLEALVKHIDDKLGSAPDPANVAGAFAALVLHIHKTSYNSQHTKLLFCAYTWLRSFPDIPELPKELYVNTLNVLMAEDLGFARLLWRDMGRVYTLLGKDAYTYIRMLVKVRQTEEANQVAMTFLPKLNASNIKHIFFLIARGFARENNEAGVLAAMVHLENLGDNKLNAGLFVPVVDLYCQRGDIENARRWFESSKTKGFPPAPVLESVFTACKKHGHDGWGREVLTEVLDRQKNSTETGLDDDTWHAVLKYAASLDADQHTAIKILKLKYQLSGLTYKDKATKTIPPTTAMYDSLISEAIEQGNHDLVKFYLQDMRENGIPELRTTKELELRSYTLRGEIKKAVDMFRDIMITHDTPKEYTAEGPQELIQTMCRCYPTCDLEKLENLYQELRSMKVPLGSATLLALLNVYLEEADFPKVKSLLNLHAGNFTPEERTATSGLLMEFLHRSTVSVEATWDAYLILVRTFPELSIVNREKVMNLFFELDKPLAAVRVLEHMSDTEDRKPNKYVYTAAFTGIGHLAQVDSLYKVHRMLTMDPFVELDTILRNAMMYAYTNSQLLGRAFFIYDEIARSPEGPDHATITLVLNVCARQENGGLLRAQRLWAQFRKMRIPLKDSNVAAYVEALAAHKQHDLAWEVVKRQEAELGFAPGPLTYPTPLLSSHTIHG